MTQYEYRDLPESACAVIRGAVDGFDTWIEQERDMTIRFSGGLELPRKDVMAYVDAWRKSGQWALRGTTA